MTYNALHRCYRPDWFSFLAGIHLGLIPWSLREEDGLSLGSGLIPRSIAVTYDRTDRQRLSGREAAVFLGVTAGEVKALLMNARLSPTDRVEDDLFVIDELLNFKRSFVTANDLRRLTRTRMETKALERWMVDAGFQPRLSTTSCDFFVRSEAVNFFYQNWSQDLEPPG